MDEVLKILHSEHDPEKISEACQLAVKVMKEYALSQRHLDEQRNTKCGFDVEHMRNCLMMVFLSNCAHSPNVLVSVTEALIQLVDLHPASKIKLAEKGIYFNIVDLFLRQSSLDKETRALCALQLATKLTDVCPENFSFCRDTNLIYFIHDSFYTYPNNTKIITCCTQLLNILITSSENDDNEVLQCRDSWRNQCCDKIHDQPMSGYILQAMNKYLADSPKLQLFGIKSLKEIVEIDGGIDQMLEYGAIDSVLHACSLHDDDKSIGFEALLFIAAVLKKICYADIVPQVGSLCAVTSQTLLKYLCNAEVLLAACEVLKHIILLDWQIGKLLLEHNIPSVVFQVLSYYHDCSSQNALEQTSEIVSSLGRCFYLMVSDAHSNMRNEVLMSAFRNSDVDLALCILILGGNINFSSSTGDTPLKIACERRDEAMVKRVVWLIASLQYVGLWKCRIENVASCVKISARNRDYNIISVLLWYLYFRDNNGAAEWSKLGLQEIKTDWLKMSFSSMRENEKPPLEAFTTVLKNKSFVLASDVLIRKKEFAIEFEEGLIRDQNFKERFCNLSSSSSSACPLQLLLALVDTLPSEVETENMKEEIRKDHVSKNLCFRCSQLTPFREILRLSFDEETLLEERLHKPPVENCTCHIMFPPATLSCVKVEEIQLAHNGLTTVNSFTDITNSSVKSLSQSVTHLQLHHNQISTFPSQVAKIFRSLVELNLSKNSISNFPFVVFKHCKCLEILDLSDNGIEISNPRFLSNSTDFKGQTASMNDDGTVIAPKEVPLFTHHLKTLKLANNRLLKFPEWIPSLLPSLERLDLRQNGIENFIFTKKFGLTKLSKLQHLNMRANKVSAFSPLCLWCMPSLLHLDLSQNNIQSIGDFDQTIVSSSKLENLNMSDNHLNEVPRFIPFLHQLKTLNLSGNEISDLNIHDHWKAKKLKELDLSNNSITDVIELTNMLTAHWSSCLKMLRLNDNKIIELPSCIGNLKTLEILDVGHNQIKILPDELGHLTNLMQLSVKENRLTLDESILNGRAQDIRKFLYARLKRSVPQNSVKLMLVGDAAAGKTTLLQSLMKLKASRSRRISVNLADAINVIDTKHTTILATVGVDVVDLPLTHLNRKLMVSAWDFAGQEDFYSTHPCFLSEHAMYVAVYDASKGPQQLHTLRPWLTAIHARATHCPVLIVGSHADLLSLKNKQETLNLLNQELFKMSKEQWFPRGIFKNSMLQHEVLDARDGSSGIYRLKTLISEIIAEGLVNGHPLIGAMVPYSYVQLGDILRQEAAKREKFPVLSYNELANLIRDNNYDQSLHFDSGSELMLAVRYLHQTGVILHFNDLRSRLLDCFFIKPAWLCQLLARVTTMKDDKSFKVSPYINNEGVLSRSQFGRNFILETSSDSGLEGSFLPRLFRLLENFEVILWQGGDHYLVPSQLPSTKPTFALPVQSPTKKLIRYFSLLYIPMGFWSRLLARLLAFADKILHGYTMYCPTRKTTLAVKKTWKDGLYLEWEDEDRDNRPFVLVEAGCREYDYAKRRSRFFVRGAFEPQSPGDSFVKVEWHENNSGMDGLEVVVPRNKSGQILLGQLVDHINGLIEEWYPGLLKNDMRGRCSFQQYSPCPGCIELNETKPGDVFVFCISDLAESILCNKSVSSLVSQASYEIVVIENDGIFVRCPFHEMLVRVADFAPEINLDDFDPTLQLDPKLLDFQRSPIYILGDGGFGSVYQANYDGQDVAVKTFHILTADMSYKMLRAELQVLAQHRHPSIISLRGFIPPAFSTPNLPLPLLAIEYAKFGSLGSFLTNLSQMSVKSRRFKLPASLRHRLAYDIADGLCFLHSRNIVYRDMKPDNILLTSLDLSSPTVAKITDYGISTLVSPFGTPGPSGSPGYSAPEVVTLKSGGQGKPVDLFPYSFKCDIYSFGLVLHEIAVGMSPWIDYVYKESSSETTMTADAPSQPDDVILKGILPSSISSYEGTMPWPYADKLITNCLLRNPEERPTSRQIVSLLANLQSLCLRAYTHLHDSKVLCAEFHANVVKGEDRMKLLREISITGEPRRRSASMGGRKQAEPQEEKLLSRFDIYYTSNITNTEVSKRNTGSVVRATLDIDRGHIIKEEVLSDIPGDISITCMISLQNTASRHIIKNEKDENLPKASLVGSSLIVAGTEQGYLLIFSDGVSTEKYKFSHQVTSLHVCCPHTAEATSSKEKFLLIGFENASVAIYDINQVAMSCSKEPLHTVSLREVSSNSPVATLSSSSNATVYASCGKHVVSLKVDKSGCPCLLASFLSQTNIESFAVGHNLLYLNGSKSSLIEVWHVGNAGLKSSFDTQQALSSEERQRACNVVVTSFFCNLSNPSLWVGLNSGHVIVYSIPHHKAVAVVHRHYGEITQLLAFRQSNDLSPHSSSGVMLCIGKGLRSISKDVEELEDDTEVYATSKMPRHFSIAKRMSSFCMSVWDADLPQKATFFQEILGDRKKLL